MQWEQIAGILRHILTFGGGWLVGQGLIDEQTMLALVGAVITIGGAVWSWLRKTPISIVSQAAHMVDVSAKSQKEVGIEKVITPTATP